MKIDILKVLYDPACLFYRRTFEALISSNLKIQKSITPASALNKTMRHLNFLSYHYLDHTIKHEDQVDDLLVHVKSFDFHESLKDKANELIAELEELTAEIKQISRFVTILLNACKDWAEIEFCLGSGFSNFYKNPGFSSETAYLGQESLEEFVNVHQAYIEKFKERLLKNTVLRGHYDRQNPV